MPLGFLYQVLSLSSDLIPVLSDLGLGFRFVFLNSISFFVCFPGNFFQRFRLIDEDLNRGIFFFFEGYESVWFGKFEIAIYYWLYMATQFVEVGILFCLSLRGLLLDFLCIIAAFTGLWNFGSWNLDILWVSSIRVRIKIRCLFLRVMTCELVGF